MAKHVVKKKTEKKERGVKWLPDLKPGKYADGLPLNQSQYLECKLILRPNHFTSRKSFFDFAKIMRRPAAETQVEFSGEDFVDAPAAQGTDRRGPHPLLAQRAVPLDPRARE